MSSSKLKEIKAIVREFDVRDPRGAMFAIEKVLDAKITGEKKQKPVFRIDVFDEGETIKVTLKGIRKVKPEHVKVARQAIKDFVAQKIAGCQCPVCQAEREAKQGEKADTREGVVAFDNFIDGLKAAGLNPIILGLDENSDQTKIDNKDTKQ